MKEIETIFNLLRDWYKFPKYQLERRLDIFFALYLPEILKSRGINISFEDIIPEFPLKKDKNKNGKETNASNNADYAIFSEKDGKMQLFLLELKTDMNSIGEDQEKYYLKAKNDGFYKILDDIITIRSNSDSWEKYDNLLDKMAEYGIVHSSLEKDKRTKKKHGWRVESTACENVSIVIIYLIPTYSNKIEKIITKEKEEEDKDKMITFYEVIDILSKNDQSSEVSKCFIDILDNLKENLENVTKWEKVTQQVKKRIKKQETNIIYATWIDNIEFVNYKNGIITLKVTNPQEYKLKDKIIKGKSLHQILLNTFNESTNCVKDIEYIDYQNKFNK